MSKIEILIKRFLGFWGRNYCTTCGAPLVYLFTRGFDREEWACPMCEPEKIKEQREREKEIAALNLKDLKK